MLKIKNTKYFIDENDYKSDILFIGIRLKLILYENKKYYSNITLCLKDLIILKNKILIPDNVVSIYLQKLLNVKKYCIYCDNGHFDRCVILPSYKFDDLCLKYVTTKKCKKYQILKGYSYKIDNDIYYYKLCDLNHNKLLNYLFR